MQNAVNLSISIDLILLRFIFYSMANTPNICPLIDNKTKTTKTCYSLTMAALLLVLSACWSHVFAIEFTENIAYNGPFNENIHRQRRRLVISEQQNIDPIFYHGVASGEPTSTDLIIWTRVTPPFQDEYANDKNDTFNTTELSQLKSTYETISVQWAISTSTDTLDFACPDSTKCGTVQTSVDIDYTVKILVGSLTPNTKYVYQFKVGASTTSDIGKTRTIPMDNAQLESWRFAVGSCKQYAHGYFNNLGDIAARNDLDMMVWLGDYIYEFPNDPLVNGTSINRIPYPNNFLYNLTHYRKRYLSHHLDVNVQAAHRELPWYLMWDDHEVVNDYWFSAAPSRWQNDALHGVDFATRKMNGYRAYFEWTPIRPTNVSANGGLHKSFSFGTLFDLIMIDARSQRTKPAENVSAGAALSADVHYAFGKTQRDWILNELEQSDAKWRIFGSDDVFGQSPPAEIFNGRVFFGEDKLEGYDAERQIILDFVVNKSIDNVISLAGGPHTGIAQKVYSTGRPIKSYTTGDSITSYPIMSEFVLDAMSAPKLFEEDNYVPYVGNYTSEWSWVSPYFRLSVDGYLVMDVDASRVRAEYWINDNTKSDKTTSVMDVALCVEDGVVDFIDCNATIQPTAMPTDDNGSFDGFRGLKRQFLAFVLTLILLF